MEQERFKFRLTDKLLFANVVFTDPPFLGELIQIYSLALRLISQIFGSQIFVGVSGLVLVA